MPTLQGFGLGEMLLIAMLVLIVFGPRRLPEITRMLGKGIREFRKGMNEIQRELEAAGRETRWQSPPAPPKPRETAADATIAGTAVAAGAAAADANGGDRAEAGGEGAEGADPAEADDAAEAEPGAEDAAADEGGEAPAPVVQEQEPPVPRDMVDPAAEFIDPWSTDSARPNFGPKPRSEPVIAPPTAEPAEVSAAEPEEEEAAGD